MMPSTIKVRITDDHQILINGIKAVLNTESGIEVVKRQRSYGLV